MNEPAEEILFDLLAQIDAGREVTEPWIRATYPAWADDLIDALRIAGLLPAHGPRRMPSRLGPFRVLGELGRGGMAIVYLCEATRAGRRFAAGTRFAIKVLRRRLEANPAAARRFRREGAVGRSIRHPALARTLAFGRYRDDDNEARSCLVAELIEGNTLLSVRRRGEPTPEPLCRFVASEVAGALGALHERGVVHRDIKPTNVIFGHDYAVRVVDLGIAKSAPIEGAPSFVGSAPYAAPEQVRAPAFVRPQADLYALGMTVFEFATGRLPTCEGPHTLPSCYSPRFIRAVEAMTQPDPARRPATAADVVAMLSTKASGPAGQDNPSASLWRPRPNEVLLGRADELTCLATAWDRSVRGDGRALLLSGPPGIGKTSVVAEFARSVPDDQLLVATCSRAPALSRSLREVIANHPTLGTALEGERPATRNLVRWLQGRPAQHNDESNLYPALITLLRSTSRQGPMLIWIEDLHEATESEGRLLMALARAARGAKLMFVATARPGDHERWLGPLARRSHVATRELGMLADDPMREMLAALAHPRRLAPRSRDHLVKQAAGNPLLLSALWAAVTAQDNAIIRRQDNRWHLAQDVRAVMPPTVGSWVEGRLETLPPDERRFIRAAACADAEIDLESVANVLELPLLQVYELATALVDAHRLVRFEGATLRFSHSLIREVVYRQMSASQRVQMHATWARAMWKRSARADREAIICRHAIRGDLARIVDRTVLSAFDIVLATEGADSADTLAEDALPMALDTDVRYALTERRAMALGGRGRFKRELEVLKSLAAQATARRDTYVQFRTAGSLFHVYAAMSRLDVVDQYAKEAERLAETLGGSAPVEALLLRANLEMFGGRHARSASLARMALAAATTGGFARARLDARFLLAQNLQVLGEAAQAQEQMERSLEEAREEGYRKDEVYAIGQFGQLLTDQHRYREALENFRQSEALAPACGFLRAVAMAKLYAAHCLLALGRIREARQEYEFSLSDSLHRDDLAGVLRAHSHLAQLGLQIGDDIRARQHTEAGLSLLKEGTDSSSQTQLALKLHIAQATLDWRAGQRPRARRCAEAALGSTERYRGKGLGHTPWLQWIEELATGGDLAAARAEIQLFADAAAESAYDDGLALAWRRALLGASMSRKATSHQTDSVLHRIRIQYLRWVAGDGEQHLSEARQALAAMLAETEPVHRECMVTRVPMYALVHQGLRLPADGEA